LTNAFPQLDALQARFEPSEHQTRTQGGKELTYISIDATINRLNNVLGPNWSISIGSTKLSLRGEGIWDAFCELQLQATIDGVTKYAYGVGAMSNKDADMSAKTALAEAIKKAGHQLGIGLYLWDPEARDEVNAQMKQASKPGEVKAKIFELAKQKTGKDKPTPEEIASSFGLELSQLQNINTLVGVLNEHSKA